MISIIVPVYNVKDYLLKSVDSILNQSYSDIEVILVDDGSTDGCSEICDNIANIDSRVKVIHKENGGLPSAWKAGVEASHGELIGFVDSDDYCNPDYFENLLEAIMQNGADIAISGYIEQHESMSMVVQTGSAFLSAGVYEGETLEHIKEVLFENNNTFLWARWLRLMKRDLIISNLHLVDERIKMGEDMGIALATVYDAKKIVLVSSCGYHYVQRNDSIMRTYSDDIIDNFELLCANLQLICDLKGYGRHVYREYTTQMLRVAMKIIKSSLSKKEKTEKLRLLRNTQRVKDIFKRKDFGKRSFKGRIGLELFRGKFYGIITLIG